ncbi:MAG: hypothetical protein V1672_03410 [Candidatus Diapherotrites archaeon]
MDKNQKEIFQKIFSLFVIFLIFSMDFAMVFAYSENNTQINFEEDESAGASDIATDAVADAIEGAVDDAQSTIENNGIDTTTRPDFTCKNTSLTPEEVQKLWDNAIEKGFNAEEITSGADPIAPEDRKTSDHNTVIIPTGEQNNAVATEVPNQKMNPNEVPWLNQGINGAFAFGIVLEDTLRVGVCENLDDNRACPLQGQNLALRNSGEGIVETFIFMKDDTVSAFRKVITGEDAKPGTMSQAEYDEFQQRFAQEDVNEFNMQTFQRTADKLIENHIITDDFDASMQTNCTDDECVIATYSMFDKYFNRWFAGEMVVSNFGPQLWGETSRLMGWARRRGGWPWKLSETKLGQAFRRTFGNPDTWFGPSRVMRIKQRADTHGFSDFFNDLIENEGWTSGYLLTKSGEQRKYIAEKILAQGGFLDQMAKRPLADRRAFYDSMSDLHVYTQYNKAVRDFEMAKYNSVKANFGAGSAQEIAQRKEFAQVVSERMRKYDHDFSLDFPEWLSREEQAGLYTYGVKNLATNQIAPLSGDSVPLQSIMEYFENNGTFRGIDTMSTSLGANRFQIDGENLVLYELKPQGNPREVAVADLHSHLSELRERVVITDRGEPILLNEHNLARIQQDAAGTVRVYDAEGWRPEHNMSADEFAGKILHDRALYNLADGPQALTQRIMDAAIERNIVGRQYTSILDKAMAEEVTVFRSYLGTLKGAAKWTVYPYVYWAAKQGGGGLFDKFSAYQLPETWQELNYTHGEGVIYEDAFVDFFANHGSDTGDIFVQVLNKLPWKMVLNEVWDSYLPFKEQFEKFTSGLLVRQKVENLAVYLSTNKTCAGCFITLKTEDMKTFEPNFSTQDFVDIYILEDTVSKAAKEKGTNLISFAHHLNISGTTTEGTGENINLLEAMREETTCRDAAAEVFFGVPVTAVLGDEPYRIAAVLGFGESLGYLVFNWGGILGSVIQQTLLVPKLHGCVDVDEGYFTHIYSPKRETENPETQSEFSTQSITETIKDGVDKVSDMIQTDPNSFGGELTDNFKEQVDQFTDDSMKNDIVEGIFKIPARSNGRMLGKQLFMFWWKGISQPVTWPTEGELNFIDDDTNTTVTVDYGDGTISINGETVIDNNYLVPLTTTNTDIPAAEIPQRATVVGLTNKDTPLFEMNIEKSVYVLDTDVLDCIKAGVMEQTGVPLNSNNLNDAFGEAKAIVTNAYNIAADTEKRRITATGETMEYVEGNSAKVTISGNRNTMLKNGSEVPVGKLESIQFEHGIIIYKPGDNELVIWLRHHKQAITSQNDISGLKATLTEVIDPITGCPVPAIDLDAIPIPGSDRAAEKVQLLNDSLGVMGPFKKIETEKKIFIFYSKKTDPSCNVNTPGCCEDYFKVIDKETGEVLVDEKISSIKQTPTGIEVTTEDGQVHTLDFSAPNGVPMVSYNGGPPETIQTAQGPNGSFYYDPETGLWYPENAQLLPMDNAFKQKGVSTTVNPDGSVSSKPGDNIFNIGSAGSDTGLNLPSLPENVLLLVLFISAILSTMLFVRKRYSNY